MATRIYLGSRTNVSTSLGYDASMTSGSALRYFARDSNVEIHDIVALTRAVSEVSSLRSQITMGQWALPGLAAQTISGTIKGQVLCSATAASAAHLALIARVMSPLGTVRGTLYATDLTATSVSGTAGTTTYEINSSATNRKLPSGWSGAGASLTSVDAEEGDYLVFDIGVRYTNTVTTSYTYTMYYGGPFGTDLPEDETDTNTLYSPWLELSHNLTYSRSVLRKDQVVMDGMAIGPATPVTGQIWPRGSQGY